MFILSNQLTLVVVFKISFTAHLLSFSTTHLMAMNHSLTTQLEQSSRVFPFWPPCLSPSPSIHPLPSPKTFTLPPNRCITSAFMDPVTTISCQNNEAFPPVPSIHHPELFQSTPFSYIYLQILLVNMQFFPSIARKAVSPANGNSTSRVLSRDHFHTCPWCLLLPFSLLHPRKRLNANFTESWLLPLSLLSFTFLNSFLFFFPWQCPSTSLVLFEALMVSPIPCWTAGADMCIDSGPS